MNLTQSDAKILAFFFAIILTMCIINVCSNAYANATYYPITMESWHIPLKDISIRKMRDYLYNNNWVDERVSLNEVEYICTLATQLSDYYDNIPPSLALAVIAQESKFYRYDKYEGALGLMQLLPTYHRERLIQCIEEDVRYSDELFYDPRLNVMTGLDYLSQLIDECTGDITFALMCYNQGPSSAYRTYVKKGITSNYATNIVNLSAELQALELTGG